MVLFKSRAGAICFVASVLCIATFRTAAALPYVTVTFPGAVSTFAKAIDGGRVAGAYVDDTGASHSFMWDSSSYTSIDPPFTSGNEATAISGTRVVGWLAGGSFGYLWDNGTYTVLSAGTAIGVGAHYVAGRGGAGGGGAYLWDGTSYIVNHGLNNVVVMGSSDNRVVGYYPAGAHPERGFLWDGNVTTLIDYPGALETQPNAADESHVVGEWVDTSNRSHAFSWNGSTYNSVDPPDSVSSFAVDVDGGNVVGSFQDSTGHQRGFFWDGLGFTTFDFGGASFVVYGVSGHNVTGYFQDSGVWKGYVLTVPEPQCLGLLVALSILGAGIQPRRP